MNNEDSLFAAALEIEDAAVRKSFLDEWCQGNPALRKRIEALLVGHEASNPLDRPLVATELFRERESHDGMAKVGEWVGPYKLLEQIGEGGFGLVFVAEQEKPVRRRVALKVIKPGMDSRQVVARFEAERQALAMMDHVNISKVLDAGTTASGRPYFVMELVHGVPITTYCDENRLTPRERLELFIPVCHAIQHAHHKGIIHRDIKPSNVLVTLYDDRPVPKVIDFGVAKAIEHRLTEKTVYTHYGTLVGTFEYVSPEQAEMNAFGVDTRSDVYSLGVLLYELLTGSTPLDRHTLREVAYGEIIRMIKECEPVRPSMRLSKSETLAKVAAARRTEPTSLASLVNGELDWIVMRCLEKDRTRRYESPNALAADIKHFLADEPVEACPPTLSYRLKKTYRRHRAAVLTSTAFVAVLVIATVASLALAFHANQLQRVADTQRALATTKAQEALDDRQAALDARAKLAEANYARNISLAYHELRIGNLAAARQLLDEALESCRRWEWHYVNRLCNQQRLRLQGDEAFTNAVFDPTGSQVLTVTNSGDVKIRDAQTGNCLHDYEGHPDWRWNSYAILSPNGELFAVAGGGIPKRNDPEPDPADFDVVVREVANGKEICRVPTLSKMPFRTTMAFSPDGSQLIVGSSRAGLGASQEIGKPLLSIYDAKTGEKLLDLDNQGISVLSLAYSSDGKRIVAGNYDAHTATVWDAETGQIVRVLEGHSRNVQDAVFSPDGRMIITGSSDHIVRVWESETGEMKLELRGHRGIVWSVAVSPDGRTLASGSADATVRLWDLENGNLIREIVSHSGRIADVKSISFNPSGTHIVTSSSDCTVCICPVRDRYQWDYFAEQFEASYLEVQSNILFAWDEEHKLTLRNLKTGEVNKSFQPGPKPGVVAIRPNAKQFAIKTFDLFTQRDSTSKKSKNEAIQVWDMETCELVTQFGVAGGISSMEYSSDGARLIVGRSSSIQGVEIYDANSGESLLVFTSHGQDRGPEENYLPIGNASFRQDDAEIVSCESGRGNVAKTLVWDSQSGEVRLELDAGSLVGDACFSASGSKIATAGEKLLLWDGHSGRRIGEFTMGHRGTVRSISFSPDETRLVSSASDGTVRVWDTATQKCLLTIVIPDAAFDLRRGEVQVLFSADSSQIVIHNNSWVRVMDAGPFGESQ